MARPVELNKTWLPGPSRGTQTFNTPSNLTIPYGRHKATISGRAGSGNNPGAQYSTNYNVNYNVQPVVGNQPEASRPATAWVTNYVQTYGTGNPYATAYNIDYTTNYAATYPGSYGVGYNVVDTQYTNVAYPASYNVVDTQYNVSYSVPYNSPGNSYATQYSVVYGVSYSNGPPVPTGNYNPPTGFIVQGSGYGPYYGQVYYIFDYVTFEVNCPAPVYDMVNSDYLMFDCTAVGNNPVYAPGYNTNYNTSYPESAWATNYNTAYNLAYNVAYNRSTPIAYNAVYAVAYNRNTPIAYNAAFNVAYNIGNQPETSRPINAYGVNYNSSYNIGTQPATAYTIVYSTNYNLAYPVGNTPAANYVINSYSPGAPGDPTTVLGVYFPGGSIGSSAPYVSDTVVQYWDYPDYKTHPISVPPGGQIVVKLE